MAKTLLGCQIRRAIILNKNLESRWEGETFGCADFIRHNISMKARKSI